jgi:metallo-beta-lactamase family protein
MDITFLGATDTVTGSRFLVRHGKASVLVDCGLFQGLKKLRERNWDPFPVAPNSIDAVVLTHAHVDHSGYLPLLARRGFRGPVYCTRATADLCNILLPDAAHLQEEEAAFANKHGYSRHRPALPLYTRKDASAALRLLEPVDFNEIFEIVPGVRAGLTPAGHILGAACAFLEWDGRRLVFSGDVGRPEDPVMLPPAPIERADYLVLESTYGDRRHPDVDPADMLAEVIDRAVHVGGTVVVPSFAVGRAQSILYLLSKLVDEGRVRQLPVFLDSPMAIDATELFLRHQSLHRLTPEECARIASIAVCTRTVSESKKAMYLSGPKVIVSASGMATGGRVLHHLKAFAGDPRNAIVFAGYQAAGTRGAAMLAGADSIKVHGSYYPVRAQVTCIENLSAHADYREILNWLKPVPRPPARVFLVHGEPGARDALRLRLKDELGWQAAQPDYGECVELE